MATEAGSPAPLSPGEGLRLPGAREAVHLLAGLRANLAHHQVIDGKALPPLLTYLGAWQSLRLSRTYADLLRDPGRRAACRFFLSDIYAPQDFSQRDYDGTRIYVFMNQFLPEATLLPLRLALEVNELTQQLDRQLAEVLQAKLGVSDRFEAGQYESAFRLCDNYDARARQIAQIVEVGNHLTRIRRLPFIGTTLRLARGPAERLGWVDMHDFLKRGYEAWKSLRRPGEFLGIIQQREMAILNRICGREGGAPDGNPFLVSDGGPAEVTLAPEGL